MTRQSLMLGVAKWIIDYLEIPNYLYVKSKSILEGKKTYKAEEEYWHDILGPYFRKTRLKNPKLVEEIIELYKEEFQDESIYERMKFYTSLMYLEESFYLPFKYFPWKIKYNENPKSFEKRFVDYFRKSEMFFNK